MKSKKLKVGIVGATGMVGKVFMTLLEEKNFPIEELRLFASETSKGKKINFRSQELEVNPLSEGCFQNLDLVFFSSGDDISKEWAPKAVQAGAYAVDNSAAFRMNDQYPLVVPEVNGNLLKDFKSPTIIANPNCSTIQLVVALKPLYDKYGIENVRVSSYQAVSGAGQPAYDELIEQLKTFANTGKHVTEKPKNFAHTISLNLIPQIGSFDENGFSSEEVKIIKETKKILGDQSIKVSAFTVRVPVLNAHSETVWVTLKKDISKKEFVDALKTGEGLVIQDEPSTSTYPMPLHVSGQDPVYVGRIHKDIDNPNTWLIWVVSDNIKKGAALNGLQIAQSIFDITL